MRLCNLRAREPPPLHLHRPGPRRSLIDASKYLDAKIRNHLVPSKGFEAAPCMDEVFNDWRDFKFSTVIIPCDYKISLSDR